MAESEKVVRRLLHSTFSVVSLLVDDRWLAEFRPLIHMRDPGKLEGGDVMRADDPRAAAHRIRSEPQPAVESLLDRAAAEQVANEALARDTDQQRAAERRELRQVPEQVHVVGL